MRDALRARPARTAKQGGCPMARLQEAGAQGKTQGLFESVYLARQPIFDRELHVHAYELLFRCPTRRFETPLPESLATLRVLANAFTSFGIERLVGKRRAFVNLGRELLLEEIDFPLPPEHLVIEVLETVGAEPAVLETLRRLKARGHVIALDDFVYDPAHEPLIELADIVKVDVQAVEESALEAEVARLRRWPVALLAEKVETREEYARCKALGFEYFQGYFLSRPQMMERRELAPNRLAAIRLLGSVQRPDVESSEVEQIIGQDVGLTYKLMRFINSALFNLPRKVDSIRQAVIYIGLKQLRQWVTLLVLSSIDDKPGILFETAMIRARMCSGLAERMGHPEPETFFTVGLFSTLDALLDQPLAEILRELPLSEEIRQALLAHRGPAGEALACTLAWERGDWVQAQCGDLDVVAISEAYGEALDWAQASMRAIGLES
ncbi:MAG: HDOD domain-containing protein [Gammaproteobacteria bacterium]|nr:MAG: HDOD domain-containing protein [Gammaproteobacteria bacterium]